MNRRLLVDSLRRNWSALLIKSGLGAVIWVAAGADLISTGMAMASSMSLAMFAGFVSSSQLVAPREVLILPIGRTGIWRTRFWFGTFIVAGAIAAGKLIALPLSTLWSQPAPGLETIAISSVLDLVAAPMMALVLSVGPPTVPLSIAVVLPLVLLGPFLPLAIAQRLPIAWNQLTPNSLSLIAAGIAVGWLAYFRTPILVATPSPTANRAALKAKGRGWLPEFRDVVGLNRFLLKVWINSAAVQVGTIVSMPFIFSAMGIFGGPFEGWLSDAREFGLLPFEAGTDRFNGVFVWIFVSVGNDSAANMLRHLRALPLTARALTGILSSISFITWINAWFVLAIFHFVALGEPPATVRLPMLVGYIGADSLFRALRLRWRRPLWLFLGMIAVVLPVVFVATRLEAPVDLIFVSFGSIAILAAGWLNHHVLTTNRNAYAHAARRTALGEIPG